MDEVVLHADAEIAANGARRGFRAVGHTHHRPADRDRLAAFQDHRERRTGGQELQQRIVERLAAVDRVMLFGQVARRLDQLESDELQALLFEALQNGPDETAMDGVGFEKDQGALHDEPLSFGSVSQGIK